MPSPVQVSLIAVILLSLFEKKKVFYCIVWDGKTMSYLNLSQKEIDKKLLLNKELIITKKDEIS